ncbi:capon-like protein isoform X2 [Anopheles arabiensis]|nr:capon-like protein isoform X2 [Anopheles arabiensis]
MALNIAVPMSGVGDLLEGFGLLSPISPVSIDFRSSIKNPLSPVGSESSGVSSLDLEDIKKQMPSSPTLLDDNEEEGSSSSGRPEKSSSNSSSLSAGSTISTTSSRTCSTSSSSSSSSSSSTASDDETNQLDEKLPENANENDGCGGGDAGASILSASPTASPGAACGKESDEPPTSAPIDDADALLAKSSELLSLTKEEPLDQLLFLSPKPTKEPIYSLPRQSIYYNNRDILDLGSNLRAQGGGGGGGLSGEFAFQYAVLPDTNNIQFFLQNRSQYHRLGPNGHVQEFRMATCACCDFKYPVNTVGANATAAPVNQSCATLNLSNLNANQIYGNLQQQQQQQQQQQIQLQQQQRLRCMQYQQQQYNYRASAGVGNSNNSMGRDYNMYQSGNGGGAAAAGGVVPSSSRFNNGIYGSGAVAGASSPNAQGGGGMAAGGSSAGNGGFFNNNALMGRDQFNPMVSMTMQYNNHNNSGANPKGISQSNGGASSLSSAAALRQQQQYELSQQQKQQYVNNYSLGAGANAANNTASSAAVRLQQQQQQQSQQSSHYYKKNQSMRYGGPTGLNANMMSSGPAGSSNWKNSMTNNAIQDTAAKLFMELNKMQQQQQQQQQQSPYYVPFL